MAIPLANGDVLSVKIACMDGDQLGLNDVGFKVANLVSSSGTTLENLTAALDTAIGAVYSAWLPTDAIYYGISVLRIFGGAAQPITTNPSLAGVVASPTGGRQGAALITKKTASAGRAGRGRVYIPFVPTANTTVNGHISSTGVTLLTAIGNVLFSLQSYTLPGPGSLDLTPSLVKASPLTFTDITSFVVRRTIATQRRRGDYGKPNGLPW